MGRGVGWVSGSGWEQEGLGDRRTSGRVLGETTGMGRGHLWDKVVSYGNGSFKESMRVTLAKTPSNGEPAISYNKATFPMEGFD